jgi:hypothetical protein
VLRNPGMAEYSNSDQSCESQFDHEGDSDYEQSDLQGFGGHTFDDGDDQFMRKLRDDVRVQTFLDNQWPVRATASEPLQQHFPQGRGVGASQVHGCAAVGWPAGSGIPWEQNSPRTQLCSSTITGRILQGALPLRPLPFRNKALHSRCLNPSRTRIP